MEKDQGIQLGIGLSQELDDMAAGLFVVLRHKHPGQEGERGPEQPEDPGGAEPTWPGCSKESMVPEVFAWTAVSNNQALIAGRAADILNSISRGPLRPEEVPEIAKDIYFTPALKGPRGTRVQLRARDLLLRGPQVLEERRQREEVSPRPGRNHDHASEIYNSPAFFDPPFLPGTVDTRP